MTILPTRPALEVGFRVDGRLPLRGETHAGKALAAVGLIPTGPARASA